jgi:hypothetical protein
MSGDVFEEADRRFTFADDASDVRPEVSWILLAELSSRDAERLAWIAAMDDIHRATPCSTVKSGNVVPDRSAIQGRIFHPRHESGCGVGVPLDITNSLIGGDGDVESEVKSSSSGTEGKSAQASPAIGCVSASGGK